ncbi:MULTISPECIES: hypothetical protein [unclassified Bradyrhizobium]|uniref:hypothetical protein n=1 Tax=unclassified Bradyrhizobium TaxID=2631580 RepID=UPI0029166FE8|nr:MULTISPECIES: hypothetical protein [unclassified Bradyrhizobium]
MSALYAMNYVGSSGAGGGAIYVGNGKILGIDVGNLRYSGSYTQQGGRLKGNVDLYAPTGGTLVTGTQVPPGTKWSLVFDWPTTFADGSPQPITLQGQAVHVVFDKIGDI